MYQERFVAAKVLLKVQVGFDFRPAGRLVCHANVF